MTLQLHDGLLQIVDVEHGQCALLTMPGSGNGGCDRMLIDCGHNATSGWTPTKHLQGLGVSHLEKLVVTNYDEDHVSNFQDLAASGISIGTLVRNSSVAPDYISHLKSETGMGCGIEALVNTAKQYTGSVGTSDDHLFPGMKMHTFRNTPDDFDDENNLSLVLFLQVYNTNFLFPGDMECTGWEKLLANSASFRAILPQVHVLIASHHGRKNGICADLFDKWGLRPQLTVISDDYKQYDTQETTQYYASKTSGITDFRGSPRWVLTTRKDGTINFSFQGGTCVAL